MANTLKDKINDYQQKYMKPKLTQPIVQPVKQDAKQTPSKSKDLEWWNPLSWASTLGDVAGDVITGLGKGVEGIVDLGLGAVGSVAGLFGSDSLENALAEAVKYDVAGNTLGQLDKAIGSKSLLSENSIIHDVAEGVGGMLPAVAVAYFTGGAGLASMGTFMAGAGGRSTEQALNEGASLGKATLYGVGSGIVEGGIEYASGKLGGTNILGKGAAGKIFSGGVGKVAKTFAEEGLEEVASDVIDPFLKRATYKDTLEMPTMNELARTFGVGGLTALAMGGSAKGINLAKYGVKGEKAQSIYNEIVELNQEEYNLEKESKLDAKTRNEYAVKRDKLVGEFDEVLKTMNTESKKYQRLNRDVDAETTVNFDARKTLVDETVRSYNERTGSDLKVEYVDNTEINGSYDPKTNTISIDKNAENPYSIVLGHEITHSTESNSKYSQFYDEVLNTIGESNLAQEREKLGKYEQYKDLSIEELNKEVVANYISENFFTNFKQAQKLISNNKTLGSKIISFIKDKIARIGKNSAEYKELKSIENKLQEIMDNKEVNLANNGELALQYKVKKYPHFNSRSEIKKELRKEINSTLNDLYSDTENNTLDDVAVQDGNKVYLIDTSREESGYTYGAYGVIEFADEERAKLFKEAKNDDIRRKEQNAQSDESVEEQELRLGNNRGISNHSREDGSSTRNTRKQSSNNAGGIQKNDGDSGVKFSVKQSPATQEQIDEKNTEDLLKKTGQQIKTTLPKGNKTIKESILDGKEAIKDFINNRNEYKLTLQMQLTNSFAGIENRAKEFFTNKLQEQGLTGKALNEAVNEEMIKFKALELKTLKADSAANYMIKTDLYDGIWKEINEKGIDYTSDFENFLLHRLNIKRMNYEYLDPKKKAELDKALKNGKITQQQYDMMAEEASEIINKPVFGEDVSAEQSEKAVKELEKKHPEFVKLAEKVYSYLDILMSIRVQAGIVSKEQREFMKKHYGNWYVPSYRDMERGANTSGVSGRGNVGVSKSVHAAKGSNLDIQSIMLSMSQQTVGVHKQAIMNELFLKVKEIDSDAFVEKGTQRQTRDDVDGFIEPKENEVFFYENGKRITYMTTKDIAIAFESLRNSKNNIIEQSVAAKGLEKLVSAMKKVTTEYNPFFAVRNLFRDASDAFIYTKYSKNLLARYKRAYKEIRNKGEYYKLYLQNGGQALSFFDRDYGIDLRKKNALLDKISMINETTELLPRLSEFIESIESRYQGDFANIPQEVADMAMYDASDITVNFARGGTLTKKMNKYLMPYLNASIQGWCKTWNTFVHPTSMHAWCMSMSKVVLMALPTLLFNEIFYDDDEEYQQLSDDIKGSYFLLKAGNNKFIRIPRGRVEAVVGDAMQRIYRTAKGEEDAFDGYMSNTVKNVSPVDNLTRTILSPVTDVATNTTWYGGNIENRSMQSLPIQERYDNNTSAIAKMLAKLPLGVSPKKWHYLLDQYSGIIGDVVLPLTSKNKDLSGLSGLTTNSLDNNKYTNKYYNVMEELEQSKNSDNGTVVDKAKMRYFNNMNSKISELYKAKKSTTDKEEQTAIQTMIVKLQKDTLEGVKELEKVLNKYSYGLSQEELYEDYYREATRECFGAEVALMNYDSRVYEKATVFNNCGISWDNFYNIYFDAQDIMADYDADGNVINGSRKQKVTKYVKGLKLTSTQKYMVMGLLGYKNANGESQVKMFLRSKGYTGEDLNEIMKICGYGK
jgi:hypothetical protein